VSRSPTRVEATRGRRLLALAVAFALQLALALQFASASATAAARPQAPARSARSSVAPTPARAGTPSHAAPSPRADSVAGARPPAAGARSGTGAPLAGGSTPGTGADAEATAEGSSVEADPLVSNGLGSPSCRGGVVDGALSARAQANCQTSGFVAAAAPTDDFGLDVHIDTGLLGLSSGGLLVSVQDLCVTPLWMALVWAVHALVVMLEWCFQVDLLDSPSVQLGIARGLRATQAAFTIPWLATAFAIGAVVLAYDGLVRRQIGQSLARAALALVMTAAGLALMLDPGGTIGALGDWANRASLGTLAAGAGGSPADAQDALDGEMRAVFAVVVEGPWCYLEFGQVSWCRDPARLDPALRAAALALAAEESARIGCGGAGGWSGECVAPGSGAASVIAHSARLLRSAHTNGAIFLALPANGAARNSINDTHSLLRAICRSEDATRCRGPSASEAEFRTNHGTWPRVGGLVLIMIGALGALLLIGFLALRLLMAAVFSLLYLLLAPLVALAPALGESGRAAFRRWGGQLLAAVVSKLLFSFVLGAVLAVLAVLSSLAALGWWTQWLLMSAFWWAAFLHRHHALQVAGTRGERDGVRRPIARRATRDVRRRIAERFDTARERHARAAAHRARPTASDDAPQLRLRAGRADSSDRVVREHAQADRQSQRLLDAQARDQPLARQRRTIAGRVDALRARSARIHSEHASARQSGDRRRAQRLALRGARVDRELAGARGELERAGGADLAATSPRASRAGESARFLDLQAQLPGAIDAHRAHERARRDYVALAGLAGLAPRDYEALGPGQQRAARLAIDRELTARRELLTARSGAGRISEAVTSEAAPTRVSPGEGGSRDTATPATSGTPVPWRESRSRPHRGDPSESTVMQDARAVAERRKRQLGVGRP
jgi:hypothetical protein